MSPCQKYFAALATVVCFVLTSSLQAAETIEDYRPLLDNSPFLPQAFKDRLAKSDTTGINNYLFVGYTKIDEDWRLCLVEKKTNIATWLKVGETLSDYTLKAFAPKKQTLSFEKDSITATLTIDKPK